MGDYVQITGKLLASPREVAEDSFPSGVTTADFATNPSQKPVAVDTGMMRPNVNSPSPAWATLDGVGSGKTVTLADTLYLRTRTDFLMRLTYKDAAGGADLIQVVPVYGLLVIEVSPSRAIVKVEVQGSGQVEYYASSGTA